jgi:hypothetical protein
VQLGCCCAGAELELLLIVEPFAMLVRCRSLMMLLMFGFDLLRLLRVDRHVRCLSSAAVVAGGSASA